MRWRCATSTRATRLFSRSQRVQYPHHFPPPDQFAADPPGSFPRIPESYHRIWLVGALLVLLGSLVMRVQDNRETVSLLGVAVPETCTFKRVIGYGCPGCGLTRSFISLSHGQLIEAFYFNAVGLPLYLLVIAQIPYRLVLVRRIRQGQSTWHLSQYGKWIAYLLAILLIVQWLTRICLAWN